MGVGFHIYPDFNARAEFLGFYVPHSPVTFEICAYIGEHYREFYADLKTSVLMSAQFPGDATMTHSKDLVFSGRIYVYYEDDLSVEQLGALAALYRQNGADFQPRGRGYATTQWLSRQNSKPKN